MENVAINFKIGETAYLKTDIDQQIGRAHV